MNQRKSDILIHRFLQAAEKFNSRPALECGGKIISYHELLAISARIANRIMQNGQAKTPVAILAARNTTAYAGILGALIAGRAFLPLNPRFPVQRNLDMMQRAGCNTMVLADEQVEMLQEIMGRIKMKPDVVRPSKEGLLDTGTGIADSLNTANIHEDHTAYFLYTSGTTGEPKGVPVSNRNVTSYLDHVISKFSFDENDRFSQAFDLTFDLSVHDLFVCWLSGACLCVPHGDTPLAYPKYINERKITVWFSVPSVAVIMDKMHMLRPGFFPTLRWSFFCGEPLLEKTAFAWQQAAPASHVVNLYGPAETTIAIAAYEWQQDRGKNKSRNGILSIGQVFENQHYCILDENDKAVKKGEQGFLHLAGSQVIEGYHNGDRNKGSFKKLHGERDLVWYDTGDLVVEDQDHDLFFMGRADHEVKISGYRVNLLEIENTIQQFTGSSGIAAITVPDKKSGTPSIVAFMESAEKDFNDQDLLNLCRNQLPWYMVPQKFIRIDQLPLNDNGKIDRVKLSEIQ